MVALTHDVDLISINECKLRTVGYAIFKCFKQFKFISGLKLLYAKLGFKPDPWNLFKVWENMETFFDVRSTFFFAPKKGCGLKSHPHREINYNIDENLLTHLTTNGWEVGVHGIDNWINSEYGIEELKMLSQRNSGNRTHWLMFNKLSLSKLDSAGYFYDSTIGYNHTVGFRSGTLQVYKPLYLKNLLELPLHIQDIGLLGDYCWEIDSDVWKRIHCLNLDTDSAIELCEKLFQQANYYGGVLTISWHYHNIIYPRDWSYIYTYIIQSTKYIDNAWVTTAKNIVEWFKQRRDVKIHVYNKNNKKFVINIDNYIPSNLPLLKLRLHIDPDKIKYINTEYKITKSYVDIKCDKSAIEVELQ